MKINIECRLSTKTQKKYIALVADLGYTQKILALGRDALELAGLTFRDGAIMEVGDVVEVGVLYDDDRH